MAVMVKEAWQTELSCTIRTLEDLQRFLPKTDLSRLEPVLRKMRLAITPHSASLIEWEDPTDPLLRMAVPSEFELRVAPEEIDDPIGDDAKSPVPFLTHRYPDRVLVYATYSCSQYCRFCFRKSKTGVASVGPASADIDRMVEYLRVHPEVKEVILSGGDPFTLVDNQLEDMIQRFRSVDSVVRIRIHSRVPANLPARITPELVAMLRRYCTSTKPVYVITHFNHPRELAPDNVEAIARLVDAGIVVRNQSALLAGVNDNVEVLASLFDTLADIRVQPYYLHQLDLAKGTNHFRVPLEKGMELMRALQGRIAGVALPRYMLDIPGGWGKIPLSYQHLQKNADGTYTVESWQGDRITYVEPVSEK